MLKKILKPMSLILVFSFLLLDLSVHSANAQMLGTSLAIESQQNEINREQVSSFIGREEVQQIMTQYGVNVSEAQKRVASLSDAEVAKMAKALDQLPAGGDAVGAIVGAAVLIFLVLLITDILGVTHVFPFVRAQR